MSQSELALEPLHFLQIWIQPASSGLPPSYTEWHPAEESENSAKVLVISSDGRDGSATIQQNADIFRLRIKAGEAVTHELLEGRGLWLQLITGTLKCGETTLASGDALSTESPGSIEFTAVDDIEALLFDLA